MTFEDYIRNSELTRELGAISDPQVLANISRYIAALRIVVTGHKDHHPRLKILIGAGFCMSDETDDAWQKATRLDGCDRIYLRFDAEDPLGPPDGMGIVRRETVEAVLYGQCRLWLPEQSGHPAIVFGHEGLLGHFVYRPGQALARVDSAPAKATIAGFERADRRLAALVASKRLQNSCGL